MSKSHPVILVAEDDEDLREMVCGILAAKGYRTVAAPDGRQALDLLARGEPVDLLFTDIIMPKLNGLALAQKARDLRPELRILYTSGYVSNACEPQTALGQADLLRKPYRPPQLLQAVARALTN